MALPVPNLDDRVFQDLVNEARSRIPLYCPEWTDHNLSDPGITLIELFAWMTELVIYRLNKVPDKNYVKFLELIGIQLAPGSPASTEITLRLAAPQDNATIIPMGTEIATVRTETQEAIIFTIRCWVLPSMFLSSIKFIINLQMLLLQVRMGAS